MKEKDIMEIKPRDIMFYTWWFIYVGVWIVEIKHPDIILF